MVSQTHLRPGAFVLAVLAGAAAGAQVREVQTYIAAFDKPRLDYTLNSFMREPGSVLELSRPAYAMELVAASCASSETTELRELLFLQSVAVNGRVGGTGITMLYAGMADGRFIGYYSPERYTFRAADDSATSSAELDWLPYGSADAVPAALGKKRPTCDLSPATDGSAVCPLGCNGGGGAGCSGTAQRKSLATACPGATDAECTPTANDRTPGCCDKNIRVYYSTSVAARGAPQELTGWTLYDPRMRPWYIEEIARDAQTSGWSGWSSVYVFSSSGNLGITRTAKMARDTNSEALLGVLAADFELGGLSNILNDTLAGDGSWAYVVERSGSKQGKLLGTSFGAPLRFSSGQRSDDVPSSADESLGAEAGEFSDSGGRSVGVGGGSGYDCEPGSW